MEENCVLTLIKQSTLFSNMTNDVQESIAELAEIQEVTHNQIVLQQGENHNSLYLIKSGQFTVCHRDLEHSEEVVLLDAGDTFGESSMLEIQTTTAEVRGKGICQVYCFDAARLLAVLSQNETSLQQYYKNHLALFNKRTQLLNKKVVSQLQEKLEVEQYANRMAIFMSGVLMLICGYTFFLPFGQVLYATSNTGTLFSIMILGLALALFFTIIKIQHYRLEPLGLTIHGWRQAIKDNIKMTLPLLAALFVLKYLLVLLSHKPNLSVIDTSAVNRSGKISMIALTITMILYGVSCIAQEIIFRCGIQAPLELLLKHRHKVILATIYSTVLFSMMHLHYSYVLSIAVFIPGLFWGMLFTRSGTVLSPIISHCILGMVAFFILGFQRLLF